MSYETVMEKVKTVPESCLDEISEFIDYIIFRYNEKYSNQSKMKEFNLLCEESQSWAKENNIWRYYNKDGSYAVQRKNQNENCNRHKCCHFRNFLWR